MGSAVLAVMMITTIGVQGIPDYHLVRAEIVPTMAYCQQEAYTSNIANKFEVGGMAVFCTPNVNDPKNTPVQP